MPRRGTSSPEPAVNADSEQAARGFLLRLCQPDGAPSCPRCRGTTIYRLAGGRMRCGGCRYTFREFAGRWINNGGLSCLQWLRLAGLFSREASANRIAEAIGASYNATYKALTALRYSLLARALDARLLLGPDTGLGTYLKGSKLTGRPGPRGPSRIPVFGIVEQGGLAFVELVPGVQAGAVFRFQADFRLQLVRVNNILYAGRFRRHHGLIFCGDDSLPLHHVRNSGREPGPDEAGSPFWLFARKRIKLYKGLSPQRFPLYLKELEFRYNHRGEDLSRLFLESLCALVPDL